MVGGSLTIWKRDDGAIMVGIVSGTILFIALILFLGRYLDRKKAKETLSLDTSQPNPEHKEHDEDSISNLVIGLDSIRRKRS
jgi:uncharacterized membrane protein